MPNFSCNVSEIATDATCSNRGGLLTIYAIENNGIDWDTMAGASYYDDDTHTILEWAMTTGALWSKFEFERKSGRLDAAYTRDTGYYETTLNNLVFKGKSAGRSITLGRLLSCCGLVLQIFDNNGLSRVVGKEYIAGAWTDSLAKGRVSRHLDTTGAFGSADDQSRDEIDFSIRHTNPLPYSSVTIAEMNALTVYSAQIFGYETGKVFGTATNKVFGF